MSQTNTKSTLLLAAGFGVSILGALSASCGLASGEGTEESGGLVTSHHDWDPIVNGQELFEERFRRDKRVDFRVGPADCSLEIEKAKCEGDLFLKSCVEGEVTCTSPWTLNHRLTMPRDSSASFDQQPLDEAFEAAIKLGQFRGAVVLHFDRADGRFVVRGTYAGPDLDPARVEPPEEPGLEDILEEIKSLAGLEGEQREQEPQVSSRVDDDTERSRKDNWPSAGMDCWTPEKKIFYCGVKKDCVYSWYATETPKVYRGECLGHDKGCSLHGFRTVRFGGILMRQFCPWADGSRDKEGNYELIPCEILGTRYFGLTRGAIGGAQCAEAE